MTQASCSWPPSLATTICIRSPIWAMTMTSPSSVQPCPSKRTKPFSSRPEPWGIWFRWTSWTVCRQLFRARSRTWLMRTRRSCMWLVDDLPGRLCEFSDMVWRCRKWRWVSFLVIRTPFGRLRKRQMVSKRFFFWSKLPGFRTFYRQ